MKQRHYVITAILWLVLTFIAELLVQYFIRYPSMATEEGVVVDEATQLLFVLGTPVFTFVIAVMGYSLANFRARGDALEAGETIYGNTTFSWIWFVVTSALCFTVIVYPGFDGLNEIWANPTADLVIKITGSQWSWRVEYPNGASSRDELVLPVDRRVKFEVASTDVLHSFWIPTFRMKIDAVPGMTTEMYTTPTKTGSHADDPMLRVQCAEICGSNHATMQLPVRVVEQAEFDAMFGDEVAVATADTPEGRGALLADELACVACHSIDGSVVVGPSWLGLFGSEETLEDGTRVPIDAAYLRESIVDPNAKIVQGFQPNIMPLDFGEKLTAEQVDDLVAYIQSLSD